LVFPFQGLAVPDLLLQLLMKLLQLIFVVALGAANLLVTLPHPCRGQTFQIGAPVPMWAREVVGQIGETGHA
jgi:hypothetical protein